MFLVDYFFFKDGRPYVDDIVDSGKSSMPLFDENTTVALPEEGGEYFEAEEEIISDADTEMETVGDIGDLGELGTGVIEENIIPEQPEGFYLEDDEFFFEDFFFGDFDDQDFVAPEDQPDEIHSAVPVKGKIAIVIDDMGMNLKQSRAAIALPSEITLAFLPYAEKVRPLSEQARQEGHELIIHAPMEAMDSDVPLGDMALHEDMGSQEFAAEFNLMAMSFDGYSGVNNHMGSKLTQNSEHMGYLMDQLKMRNLYFLDSRTIHTSVAMDVATANGVPTIQRDVFLDHEETLEYISAALKEVEGIAAEHGSVVAIGHPKENTMQALKSWIPTLEKQGFELVPLSELIHDNPKTVMNSENP